MCGLERNTAAEHSACELQAVGVREMDDVGKSLEEMGQVQYLLAFVFLCCYAFALGQFIGTKGRLICSAVALVAAMAFAAMSHPWEQGVMIVALAIVGMGLFVGLSWLAWVLMCWTDAHAAERPAVRPQAGAPGLARGALLSRLRARLRFI